MPLLISFRISASCGGMVLCLQGLWCACVYWLNRCAYTPTCTYKQARLYDNHLFAECMLLAPYTHGTNGTPWTVVCGSVLLVVNFTSCWPLTVCHLPVDGQYI